MRPADTLHPPLEPAAPPAARRSTVTTPYGWPWDGAFDPRRLGLVVTGAQYGLVSASNDGAHVLSRIVALTSRVRDAGGIVCFVRHGAAASSRPLLPTPGTVDWQLCVDAEPDDIVVDAGGWDGFFDGPLDRLLRARGRDLLVMCGFAHEAAVDGTCRSANDRGYECLTLTDLVASIDTDTSRHALSSVTMSGGIFGTIGPTSALLQLLDPTASEPEPSEPNLETT